MISDVCDRDDHGACFDDELDGCRCECHPTDCLAGIGRTTTEQPSTGGARQATPPKRADGRGPTHPVRAARDTLAPGSAGRAVPPSPVGGTAHLSSPQRRERAAAAETPGPETAPSRPLLGQAAVRARVKTPAPVSRAAHLDRAAAMARVPDKTPTGGTLASSQATSVPPAGSTGRTFTIALPPGMKLLSLNDRLHYGERYRRSEALKKAAWAVAIQRKIPRLECVSIIVEYQPRDRRRRDPDNIAASAKAAIDGCRAARVLPQDDSRHVTEVTCRIGEPYPLGRLVLHLTEVEAATGGDVT